VQTALSEELCLGTRKDFAISEHFCFSFMWKCSFTKIIKLLFISEVLLTVWQWLWPVVQVMGTAEHSDLKQLVLTLRLKRFYAWTGHQTWTHVAFWVRGTMVPERATWLSRYGLGQEKQVSRSGQTSHVPGCKGIRFGNLT